MLNPICKYLSVKKWGLIIFSANFLITCLSSDLKVSLAFCFNDLGLYTFLGLFRSDSLKNPSSTTNSFCFSFSKCF